MRATSQQFSAAPPARISSRRGFAGGIVATRSAFEAAGIRFTESEVHTVLLENKAGVLANVTQRLGDAHINLEALYVTGITDDLVELAVVSNDPKKAKKILEEY